MLEYKSSGFGKEEKEVIKFRGGWSWLNGR
jgi:hypothetical protein